MNEVEVLHRVTEERNTQQTIKRKKEGRKDKSERKARKKT